jgi:KDO2-lipid IV(A) lauroyltransferase
LYQPRIPQNKAQFKWLVYPWFWWISVLPLWLLNLLSNAIYCILYRLVKYRVRIVRENLTHAFPQISKQERSIIEKAYYRHLADLFIETIKGMNLNSASLKQFVQLENNELLDSFYQSKRSALIVLSHCGNWEWSCLAASQYTSMPFYVVYKPLSNQGFNAFMYRLRSKSGSKPVAMNETLRLVNENSDIPYFLAMVGDQNPGNVNHVHWNQFLNQETAFLNGPAKISQKFNIPIIYLKSRKIKRHHYVLTPELIVDYNDNQNFDSQKILKKIVKSVEDEILAQPEIWLWSHRRWKHKRNK